MDEVRNHMVIRLALKGSIFDKEVHREESGEGVETGHRGHEARFRNAKKKNKTPPTPNPGTLSVGEKKVHPRR